MMVRQFIGPPSEARVRSDFPRHTATDTHSVGSRFPGLECETSDVRGNERM